MTISVIVPVYNKARYLSIVLEQIKVQSFSDFECILINDGSTDVSGSICDEFAAADPRFRVFHIPNGGVSHARNLGLEQARGDYVTFIDGDDGIHPDYLKNLYGCMVDSGADMVIGNLEKFWVDRPERQPLAVPYQGLYHMDVLLPSFAKVQQMTGIYGFCVAKLLKREIIGTVRFDESIKLAEDLDFYLSIYPKVQSVYFETKPWYYYLQAAENSSMLDKNASIDYYTQLKIQKKLHDFLAEADSLYGENRSVMNRRLYDYVYFCLFYGKLSELGEISQSIRTLSLPPRERFSDRPAISKLLLWCFDHRMDRLTRFVVGSYRKLRKAIRELRGQSCFH